MDKLILIWKYIVYWFKSTNAHGIQSPFVFELYNDCIIEKNKFYSFDNIESIRSMLLLSNQKIEVKDFGAGSKVHNSNTRRISGIAKYAAKSPKFGQILFRLANKFKPKNIIEIGTSLGISTMYLAAPNSNTKVYTIEGCPNIAKVAKVNFKKIGFNNISLINDTFEKALPNLLEQMSEVEMVYIDGNHTKNATLSYFNQLLPKITSQTILIFDDIYWSSEMEDAWGQIKNHPKITVTIDLFELGIVFFNPELSKENFVLRV